MTKVSLTVVQVTHLTSLTSGVNELDLVLELPYMRVRSSDAGRRKLLCGL